MDKKAWLTVAAGFGFFMAACQAAISISPAAAAYFGAPPGLLADRWLLFFIGEGATLVLVVFGLYALSGAGRIRRLPLLRTVLTAISALFVLRGLFIVLTVLEILGLVKGSIQMQGVISHLVFLAAGIAYSAGTVLNWRAMRLRR